MDPEKRSKELAPFQPAAVVWCKRRGIDPNAEIEVPHPMIRGATVKFPFWIQVAERMLDLSELMSAMRAAHEASDNTEGPAVGSA